MALQLRNKYGRFRGRLRASGRRAAPEAWPAGISRWPLRRDDLFDLKVPAAQVINALAAISFIATCAASG